MAKIYGYWTCDACHSANIRGDKINCPQCGNPRNKNTKFYMTEKHERVGKEQENNEPDWLCAYCGSLTSAKSNICPNCGSKRNTENKNYFQLHCDDSSQNISETINNVEKSTPDIQIATKTNIKTRLTDLISNNLNIILICIAILLTSVIFGYLLSPVTDNITIDSFSWERSIEIEEYTTCHENGWFLPSQARLTKTATEIKEYEQVFDHYETKTRQIAKQRITGYESEVVGYQDLGNGQFDEIIANVPIYETYYETETYEDPVYRQEPVYETKYYYDIERWLYLKTIKTTGNNDEPYWGEYILTDKQRESGRKSVCYAIADNKKYKITDDIRIKLNIGDAVSITYSTKFRNKITDISVNQNEKE